jgi:hypothetical protein
MTASDFLYELIGARKAGFEDISINVNDLRNTAFFPNVAVPIAALIDVGKEKTEFTLEGSNGYIDHLGFIEPFRVGSQLGRERNVLNKIWSFETSEDTFRLTREFVDELYQAAVVETEGVLAGLEWCLGEVLENVVLHSAISKGYVMGQLHTNNQHVVFSVVDLGQGIYNSLLESDEHRPRGPVDAITLAMREGITRDTKTNQGNGLWGLHNILVNNRGQLTIVSGGGGVRINGNRVSTFDAMRYGFMGGGTLIEFRFDLRSPIQLETVLGGYIPQPLTIVKNADEFGDIHFVLKDQKTGFGTRDAGIRTKNEVLNLKAQTNGKVLIDFEGIGIVTSSFADEFIGKLYAEMGPINFASAIVLINMNDAVKVIIDRAIVQRLSSSFKKKA